ncbi:5-oxoprolinase subunit C family protein [Paraburkholderia rhynchosiae]|uniref:5-oxoprolinase subunit C n=1 Tax=Paraburkholderia rhynchosiae TaxID=487049 RepID=A0A2N7W481_9BURK|nr:biotin-dependent carboxyltransferase family protein [Paraburkholderia rhynchosiae]PMS24199.1 allophanate hydrolase [Paraburkholderia rhynchosiae]CAB3737406.1 5-oxoprolinase subunit C [Paraburkholderia rhynchosiae]
MIEILTVGPLCSIQDEGRRGYRNLGLGLAGAMDQLAYRVGNVLCGNDAGVASLEMTVFPVKLRFGKRVRVALSGAACPITVDEKKIPPWWSFVVEAGQTLTVSAPLSGVRAYLSVHGGLAVPDVLGSRSTDIKSGLGGHEGRCLKRGDVLGVGEPTNSPLAASESGFGVMPPDVALTDLVPTSNRSVRVMPGAEFDRFSEAGLETFWNTGWNVTPDSNRIGYRLEGPEVEFKQPVEMLSHGILPGVIQVPPSGRPIVIMSDGQTSGGYPKIGTVIEADLWRLAQTPIGSQVRFEEVSVQDAVLASTSVNRYVSQIENSLWRVR